MLKVALVLSGQPRFYENLIAYNSFKKHIIDKYNTDIYFHTWFKEDTVYNYAEWSDIRGDLKISGTREDFEKNIVKLYNPRSYIIEEPKEFSLGVGPSASQYLAKNMPSMFYSMSVADMLRQESKIEYDFVVRARFDTLLNSCPDFVILNMDKPIIYVPDNCPNPKVCNDNFSITSGKYAEYVYQIYQKLDEYGEKYEWSPEIIWTSHNSATHEFVKLKFDQTFIRK